MGWWLAAEKNLAVLRTVLQETPEAVLAPVGDIPARTVISFFALRAHLCYCCAAEKNLGVLKTVLQETPGAVLALVGDGPSRASLEEHFRGLPVTFMVRPPFCF